MIVSVVSPINSSYLYPDNNRFTAIFNDPLVLPSKAKIRIHSAYLSVSPKIKIETNVNDRVDFVIDINTLPSSTIQLTIVANTYTPQELANAITSAWLDATPSPIVTPYAVMSFKCEFDNISGCFSFVFIYNNPSTPTPDLFDILYTPTLNVRASRLSYIMGFNDRPRRLGFNSITNGQEATMVADNSVSYYDLKSPIALINVENLNIKNNNNYNSVKMRFVEHLRNTNPQCLNNVSIVQYDKLYSCLDNDEEIIINSMDISIRNVDGSLMDLDIAKATSILFEIRHSDEDETYTKKELVPSNSKNPMFKK